VFLFKIGCCASSNQRQADCQPKNQPAEISLIASPIEHQFTGRLDWWVEIKKGLQDIFL